MSGRCRLTIYRRQVNALSTALAGDDNGLASIKWRVFPKTIKIEMIWRTKFNTSAEAHNAIARYIDGFYNPIRRHSALDYLSPAQFEKWAAN